jgi:hypothetical protein
MMAPHAGLERRVLAALDATPPRIPVVIGGCGSGRTTLLHALNDRLGRDQCQYVDVERAASTPERFQQALAAASPFTVNGASAAAPADPAASARAAFDRTLGLIGRARARNEAPATFLLDEVLELRTFESFPGLRHVLREMLHAMAESQNRFVLTSRYVARAHRLLRDGHPRFEVIHLPPLGAAEVTAMLPPMGETSADDRDYLGRTIQVLADGRAAYVRALSEAASSMSGGGDPISALTALLTGEGALAAWCGHRYELRLHKARGYGALKAILEILAEEEPLTLTEVAHRLHRTPGSTKDYLSWLEDVDLIVSRQKRYSFSDPLLRLWVRLHCRPVPPSVDEVAREVQAYAMARLPQAEPAHAMATAGVGDRKDWGIIEID